MKYLNYNYIFILL